MSRGSESHCPEDHHITLCEVISSRLRVACVSELIISLLIEVTDGDVDALLDNLEEG
jgi:hypothetical protein